MEQTEVKVATIDPSAIGLFGLAMVTLVASSQKLGLTSGTSLIIPWAIFLGAFAQLFAAIHDAKKQNVFGTTAFGAYAFFWFAVAGSWLIQNGVFGEKMSQNADARQLGFAFFGYLIFTLVMTIGAVETNKVLFSIFVLIDFLFIGLTLSAFNIMHHEMHLLAAYSELAIAIVSFYAFAANVLNKHFNYIVLPLGKPFGVFVKK